jgi:tetratricopeptide (TPR) repeat protein
MHPVRLVALFPWLCLAAFAVAAPASADDAGDCHAGTDDDAIVTACSNLIAAGNGTSEELAQAYLDRGRAYGDKGDADNEMADLDKAIELDPKNADAYATRGSAYGDKGDYDSEIGDETKAIELDPENATAYYDRGSAYESKGDNDNAIADEDKAIEIGAEETDPYVERGIAYDNKGDHDHAIADYSKAIELDPSDEIAYYDRAIADGGKDDYDAAIADYGKAIELKSDDGEAYYGRGDAYAAKNDKDKALADLREAVRLIPETDADHGKAADRIAELEKELAPPAPTPAVALVRRVALVIGNSDYAAVGKLVNPPRDADAIASALTDDRFDVTRAADLSHADFVAAIKRFEDAAADADWAVIYYAGHGLQLDGVNYLIPVDAKLAADRDVQDEAVPLGRVLEAVSGAHKLGLIIVDACRNDPFLANMHFAGGKRAALSRGLARIEPQGTTLVEFSARDGQEAEDGDDGGNSPFAAALVKRLAAPGLEVGKLLRQVHEDVLAATSNQQEPMFWGNLPAEDVFFRPSE